MGMKANVRIGVVIALFSIVTTCVIVGGFYFWQKSAQTVDVAATIGTDFYAVSPADKLVMDTTNSVQLNVNTDLLINNEELNKLYYQSFFSNLPLVLTLICLIVIAVTIILWMIIRGIYKRQTLSVIDELLRVEDLDERNTGKDPIGQALNHLRDTATGNFDDFKRLSSYLTHDQKNTIAVLRTNLEQKEDSEEELALIDELTSSVDDILTLTSNDDETTELVDVAFVCAEVCDAYQKFYPAINFEFDETADLMIIAKYRWIYRAVSNLLSNSIKYGQNRPILVSLQQERNSVIIKITDQGLGLDAAEQKHIFDHKYRVKGLKQDGYGIGLSVVEHVCDLCQGFVFVESQKNQGSTFCLSFPSA
ncbi:signal transduction histidine kinase [Enterococcus sp. PF1-24]|uniref:sensor histidine kinase n=1 Tax=unclassified Enterococcus TaxID=2608891 RepID=UPI0024763D7F|nr:MULTISPECIES: HAMP domain-containing sensor histidine kinase [unclassified Enterococcus]MDH6363147.1 signal transduction histidine kinase [Enterococcus sp. PFB1-1]MDH6400241.1 signal transduction histidine kinase [Enterococcus sp. PF1-24]